MKKRLFIFLPYVPFPLMRGVYQRVYHLTEELAKHFQVDLFCLSSEAEDPEHLPRFQSFCNRVRFEPFEHPPWAKFLSDRIWHPLPTTVRHWWSDGVLASLRDFTAGQDYDLIQFCDLVLWPYIKQVFPDHPLRIIDRSRVDWLYQTEVFQTKKHSVLGAVMAQENLMKIARLEKEIARELSLSVVCGVDDRTFLEEKLNSSERVFVLANGANTDFFNADEWPPTPTAHPSALFCGALDYEPNTDGLDWYFREIHPLVLKRRPDFRVTLVGKSPTPAMRELAKLPSVDFAGEVPDVRPYYQQAWMQIVPLRIGGGTRLKIAEGLAMANPVVSTTLGAQGLDLVHDHHLLLADTPETFADAIVRYLDEPDSRQLQGTQGRRHILDHFTWPALGAKLAARFDSLTPA